MFKKNIYLVYPAGYSGSYVSWFLSKSEISTKDITIDDPINVSNNIKYGGVGTSHLHHRNPTHANIDQIMCWMILNQPKDKRIYLINGYDTFWLVKTLYYISMFDRDPVIIQISADDKHYNQLGYINAVTKWPLYFEIQGYFEKYGIDFYNLDKNSLEHRNIFVKNYYEIFTMPPKINLNDIESTFNVPTYLTIYKNWYDLRNRNNPHEVNEEQFIKPSDKIDNFYHLDLSDIYSESLSDKLEEIMKHADAGDFDFEYVKSFHHTYIEAQQHLKYVDEINEFKKTKVLTEYLNSHPLIQALVIREIYDQLPADWESKTLQEIVKAIQ